MAGDGEATRGKAEDEAAGEGTNSCACERDADATPTGQPDDRCLGMVPRLLPHADPRRAHHRDGRERGPVASRERRPG